MARKTLQELTIKDNFLFAAVMMNPDNCRGVLECTLGFDFDPVGLGKYRYTLKKTFCEDETYDYKDGTHTYFLSTKGKNDSEVPVPLVKFLKFVGAKLPESMEDYEDGLVSQLQTSIRQIKSDREMGNRYMVFEEMMKREFKDGKIEGKQEDILEILEQFGTVSDSISDKISNITDLTVLKDLLKVATKVTSLEEFEARLDELVK